MNEPGLIAIFRGPALVHTGNPIPAGFLQPGDTVHLGIGVFDAGMFAGVEGIMIIGAGDSRAAGSGTRFVGSFPYGPGQAERNSDLMDLVTDSRFLRPLGTQAPRHRR